MIPNNNEILATLKQQLSYDFNCRPEDFDKDELELMFCLNIASVELEQL